MKKPPVKRSGKENEPAPVPLPTEFSTWNNEDRAGLAAFFRGNLGKKLRNQLVLHIAGHNEWATNQPEPLRACGRAQGFKSAHDFILSLAVAQNGKPEPPADTNGTAESLAHLRP